MNTITIGLDLGDRRHAACILDAAGEAAAEELISNPREFLEYLSQRFPGVVIAMETGTHSPWISRWFEARGHRVHVANARQVRAISQSTTKSDWADAQMLARLARVDPKLLSPVRHRSEEGQRALSSIKVRETLVRSRISQTNTLRFLLKCLGIILPSGAKATVFVSKTRVALDTATCALIEPLLVTLDRVNGEVGLRLSQRGGSSAKKCAVIAVPRKLAVMLLAMWKSGADYRPLPAPAQNSSRGSVPATAISRQHDALNALTNKQCRRLASHLHRQH